MVEYSKNPDVNKILNEVEEILMESIGRFQAQRFIGLFCNLNSRNIWEEIYNKGKEEHRWI